MGIWRPVKLLKTGPVALKNVFVKPSLNTETLKEASLTLSADLVNHSMEKISGQVTAQIEDRQVQQDFTLNPGETRKIIFNPSEYKDLEISNPRLWWPNNLGDPELYQMNIVTTINTRKSDEKTIRFGIREIEEYFNEKDTGDL